jgi:hypothetical protein
LESLTMSTNNRDQFLNQTIWQVNQRVDKF